MFMQLSGDQAEMDVTFILPLLLVSLMNIVIYIAHRTDAQIFLWSPSSIVV